jgi:hypothetical protein
MKRKPIRNMTEEEKAMAVKKCPRCGHTGRDVKFRASPKVKAIRGGDITMSNDLRDMLYAAGLTLMALSIAFVLTAIILYFLAPEV